MITENNTNNIKSMLANFAFSNNIEKIRLLINENKDIDLNELIPWNSEIEQVIEESEAKENYEIDSPKYYTTLLNLASKKAM